MENGEMTEICAECGYPLVLVDEAEGVYYCPACKKYWEVCENG